MSQGFSIFFLVGIWLLSAGISTLTGPFVIRLYNRLGWIDDPQKNVQDKTLHRYPVPRGGGLVVATGVIAATLLLFPWSSQVWGVMIGALLLLVSGTLDDRYDIHPFIRYAINILAALFVIAGGVGINYITNPFGNGVLDLRIGNYSGDFFGVPWSISLLADGLALLWIVWNMNAVNWAKGVDGQLPGFVTIAGAIIAVLSLQFSQDISQLPVTVLALGVSGAFFGLLVWNRYPQKMMPGYAAGSLAGYFLSVLGLLSGAKVATILLLLALPTADGIFAVVRRLAAGKMPYWGDRGHLHHRLLDSGWSIPRIAALYWISTLVFGILALNLRSDGKLYAIMAAGLVFIALLLWVQRSLSSSKPSDLASGLKMEPSLRPSSSRASSSTTSRHT